MSELQNIQVYWDNVQNVVGIFSRRKDGQELFRVEEPRGGRESISDEEILAMVDKGLEDPYLK